MNTTSICIYLRPQPAISNNPSQPRDAHRSSRPCMNVIQPYEPPQPLSVIHITTLPLQHPIPLYQSMGLLRRILPASFPKSYTRRFAQVHDVQVKFESAKHSAAPGEEQSKMSQRNGKDPDSVTFLTCQCFSALIPNGAGAPIIAFRRKQASKHASARACDPGNFPP
jgi:hypothetical protein